MNGLFAAYATNLLMPWRQKDPLTRAASCTSSLTMAASIAMIFTDKARWLLLALVAVFVPLMIVHTVRDLRRNRRDLRHMKAMDAVMRGDADYSDLPIEVQEDIRVEYARYHLSRDED